MWLWLLWWLWQHDDDNDDGDNRDNDNNGSFFVIVIMEKIKTLALILQLINRLQQAVITNENNTRGDGNNSDNDHVHE